MENASPLEMTRNQMCHLTFVVPDLIRGATFLARGLRCLYALTDVGGAFANTATASYFLLFRQKKVTKEKPPQPHRPRCGFPVLLARSGRCENSGSWVSRGVDLKCRSPSNTRSGVPPFSLRCSATQMGASRATIAALAICLTALMAGCSSVPKKPSSPSAPSSSSKPGGFYQDDGPGADAKRNNPEYLDSIPDAVPREERYHSGANRPYTVFGRSYVPVVNNEPFRQTGIASWYGRKFHGNMTSIGEIYDMYAMTAAHPTLPLPSYVRVTNPANQRSVVVRVNDRGPFHSDRIIDLSYAAAYRIGITQRGSGQVVVERVFAGERPRPAPSTQPTPPAPPITVATMPPPPTTAVTISPITADGKDLFLQLGAFGSQENANIFRDRMARELDWNREPLIVTFRDGLWRVRMGPYASRLEAEAIQARVRESHDFSPVISNK